MSQQPHGETTSGLRAVLSAPVVYRTFQRGIGADNVWAHVASLVVADVAEPRVLDLGCGTGDFLGHLPATVDYVGLDHSEEYIASASSRFGDRGVFLVGTVDDHPSHASARTAVSMVGVLHHLTDDDAAAALDAAKRALAPGGRFVSIDPCLVAGQSWIARKFAERDRGQFVRTDERLRELVSSVFDEVDLRVRHDLLRVPYTHAICVAS